MTKKKPTLKEQFKAFPFEFTLEDDWKSIIWDYFEPHLKKSAVPPPKINIPFEKIVEYNEMFPAIKAKKTGKALRCNLTEVTGSFERFFKMYPDYSWDVIFAATARYLQEEQANDFTWTVRSKYFPMKRKDGIDVSELAEYCVQVLEGSYFTSDEQQGFEPRIR